MAQQPPNRRLSRDDWTAAALAALAEGGVAAVAIEPLAKRLGATKGSAYWHFANRDALLAATLERWERENTEAVIDLVEVEPDALSRLRLLAETAFAQENDLRVELALLAAADLPEIASAMHRVVERRLDYMTKLFEGAGFDAATARRRAVLTYFLYLGNANFRRHLPAVLPGSPEEYRALVDDALKGLLAP